MFKDQPSEMWKFVVLCAEVVFLNFIALLLAMLPAGLYDDDVSLQISWLVDNFCPDWHISTTLKWIAMKLGSEIHRAQRMISDDFGDPRFFIHCHRQVNFFYISS